MKYFSDEELDNFQVAEDLVRIEHKTNKEILEDLIKKCNMVIEKIHQKRQNNGERN